MQEPIEVGYQVFVSDGGEEFGAVREVSPNGRPELVIYVENGGDFIEEERRRARTLLIHLNNGTISELHGSYLMSFFISWGHNLGRFFAEVLFLKLRILEHLHYRILENLYRFLPLGEPQGERDGELVDEKARNYSSAREATFRHLPIRRHTIAATLSAEKYVTVLILSVYRRFTEIDLVRYAACSY